MDILGKTNLIDPDGAISNALSYHYSIFQTFWSISSVKLTEKIPTAQVSVIPGETPAVLLEINPKFWESLSFKQKTFIIVHECLHVLLAHTYRMKNTDKDMANFAADLIVNHTAVDRFGFVREEIDPDNKLCWWDRFWKEPRWINPTFEELYQKLIKDMPSASAAQLADCHSEAGEDEAWEKVVDKILENASESQKRAISQLAGHQGGDKIIQYKPPIVHKRKWESVIQNWVMKHSGYKYEDSWRQEHRRLSQYDVPANLELHQKNKIKVWFFLDTSGSCEHLAPRFMKAAASLPTDRFDVKLFCFDTKVYPTSLKDGKLYGFGGTRFSCIEQYIQSNSDVYPKAVFVITDGFGDKVNPELPKNWHWFICQGGSAELIPALSKQYKLEDYE